MWFNQGVETRICLVTEYKWLRRRNLRAWIAHEAARKAVIVIRFSTNIKLSLRCFHTPGFFEPAVPFWNWLISWWFRLVVVIMFYKSLRNSWVYSGCIKHAYYFLTHHWLLLFLFHLSPFFFHVVLHLPRRPELTCLSTVWCVYYGYFCISTRW